MIGLIICLLVIAVVARFLVKKIKASNKTVSGEPAKTYYSWSEILWPFNVEPFKIYKHLSPENKGAFWSISGTVIIAIITSWLGFTVQHMINSRTQNEFGKLCHYQIVEQFTPALQEFYDSTNQSGIMDKLYYAAACAKGNSQSKGINLLNNDILSDMDTTIFSQTLLPFLENEENWSLIARDGRYCAELSGKLRKYLYSEKAINAIELYSKEMLLGERIVELINDTLDVKSFINDSSKIVDDLTRYLTSSKVINISGININSREIAIHSYSMIKGTKEAKNINKAVYRKAVALTINQFITMPMLQTQMQLNEEIKPPKETNNFWSSVFFLLLSCLIGYIIF